MNKIKPKHADALDWLMSIAKEVEYIVEFKIGAKYKLMLLMTYIDIFSKIWNIYNKNSYKKQKEIFEIWSDKFVFNSSNDTFIEEKNEILPLNSQLFYTIRNSLIHFSSLPNNGKMAIYITDDNKSEFYNRCPHVEKGKHILVLSPKIINPLVLTAFISTLEEIDQDKDEKKYEYTMLKISKKLRKESAMLLN